MIKLGKLNIIVAANQNLVIGKNNDLPWHLPEDLKHFKKITNGHTVIMGRKCWESIPENFRPLPNRTNIVITRNLNYKVDGAEISNNLKQTLTSNLMNGKEVFIIGGGEIYKKAFKLVDYLYMTKVFKTIPDGDTYLKGFNENEWEITKVSELKEYNGIHYRFEEYKRIKF